MLDFQTMISLYAAIVSSLVAIVQFIQWREGRRFIHMQISRAYGNESEGVKLKISNRSTHGVEIESISINNLGIGGEVGFHELAGFGIFSYKDDGGLNESESIELGNRLTYPFKLAAGEAACVFYSFEKHKKFSDLELPDLPGEIKSNLFNFQVSHSRSDESSDVYFEVNKEYGLVP